MLDIRYVTQNTLTLSDFSFRVQKSGLKVRDDNSFYNKMASYELLGVQTTINTFEYRESAICSVAWEKRLIHMAKWCSSYWVQQPWKRFLFRFTTLPHSLQALTDRKPWQKTEEVYPYEYCPKQALIDWSRWLPLNRIIHTRTPITLNKHNFPLHHTLAQVIRIFEVISDFVRMK